VSEDRRQGLQRRGVAALVLVLAAAAGCGSDGTPDLDEAKRFRQFELYYLGSSFEGLPLTDGPDEHLRDRRPPRPVGFIYGDCEPEGDAGCAPPLEIQVWPSCMRNPTSYSGPGSRPRSRFRARAVPAAEVGGGTDVYTGRVTIAIFSDRPRTRRAIAALRGLNTGVEPGDPLPSPTRAALEGRAAC
jgi:hypothetical protein